MPAGPAGQPVDVIEGAADGSLVDEAALIWAEASAARDGDPEVAGLDLARPVIQRVLGHSPRALLLIARTGGEAAGFAAIRPLDETTAELSYFGVRPRMWGRGVGESLLRDLVPRLRAAGYRRAVLDVYTDNGRAVALYERLGWRPAGAPQAHPRSGKPEQRYELPL